MPLSPRKFVSTMTNSTVNKGVEARETEIANIRLGIITSPYIFYLNGKYILVKIML